MLLRVYGTLRAHALHVYKANLARGLLRVHPSALLFKNFKPFFPSRLQEDFSHTFTRGFSPYFHKPFFTIHFPIVGPGSAYTFTTGANSSDERHCLRSIHPRRALSSGSAACSAANSSFDGIMISSARSPSLEIGRSTFGVEVGQSQ